MNPRDVGERTESLIASVLMGAGKALLFPIGGDRLYDFVVDESAGRFSRIQCRTAHLDENGAVLRFHTNASPVPRQTELPFDFFAVYCPALRKLYMVPVEEATPVSMVLRLKAPKGKLTPRAKDAKVYEFTAG